MNEFPFITYSDFDQRRINNSRSQRHYLLRILFNCNAVRRQANGWQKYPSSLLVHGWPGNECSPD